jgi:hypothetical protein
MIRTAMGYPNPSEVDKLREFWTSSGTNRDGDLDFYLSVVCARSDVVRPHVIIQNRDSIPKTFLIGRLEQKCIPIAKIGYVGLRTRPLRILTFIEKGTLVQRVRRMIQRNGRV